MAKLVRAEDIMQQKVKRLMLYKDSLLAQIKSQVSHGQSLAESSTCRCVKQCVPLYVSDRSKGDESLLSCGIPRC